MDILLSVALIIVVTLLYWEYKKVAKDRARWRSAAEGSMADVRRLAKERDWLVGKCSDLILERCGFIGNTRMKVSTDECWRVGAAKAARDAVAGEEDGDEFKGSVWTSN